MARKPENGSPQLDGGPYWSDRLIMGTFLLFLTGLAGGAVFILLRDGQKWVIFAALIAGALFWGLEYLESKYTANRAWIWNPSPGFVVPVAVIALATFVVCLPTLNSYFSTDEFAYIRLFHKLSLSQFLGLFHTDLSQGVLGWNPKELRPLYGLSFMVSYSLWGLKPLGYHLISILLHVINSAMVFLIARKMAPGENWRAGFAGLLFAMQPVHSWTISWTNGSLTEAVPSLFYISSFLCFVLFRSTRRTRYLAMSIAAFAACLLSKETSVTLPIMLVSYDLFRVVAGKDEASTGAGQPGSKPWVRFVLAYIPYAVLLLVYLELRRIAFTSYLLEDQWGSHIHEATSSAAGFWLHFRHFWKHLAEIQSFNIRQLMLSLPVAELSLALGIYVVATIALLCRWSKCRRSIEVIVYFGLVWYAITNLPLLATYLDPHHLYLPAVGPCIATAFLIAPACAELQKRIGYLRPLGAVLLVGFCAFQLWKMDTLWARKAEVTQIGTEQLAGALAKMPRPILVVVWFPHESSFTESWDEDLPYSMQEPFQASDLYSRARIVEDPDIYCCLNQWWLKTRRVLDDELAGTWDGQVAIELFVWDERSTSFETEIRTLPRKVLRAYITKSLGEPLEQAEFVDYDRGKEFVERLVKLAWESP